MVSCKDVQCLDASYHPSKDVVLDASVLRKKRGLLKQHDRSKGIPVPLLKTAIALMGSISP